MSQANKFFTTLKNGEYIKEELFNELQEQLTNQLNSSMPNIALVDSLLHRIGNEIIATHKDQLKGSGWNPQATPWQAMPIILDIGNEINNPLEIGEYDNPFFSPLLKIKRKARKITFAIIKLIVELDHVGPKSDVLFNTYPLIIPITQWLSIFNNLYGNTSEIKNFCHFLGILSRKLLGEELDELKKDESFKNNLANALVNGLTYQQHMKLVDRNIAQAKFIETIPYLAEEIWNWSAIHGSDQYIGEHKKNYETLLMLIQHPQKNTTVEDLRRVFHLPFHFDSVHFSLFCQLWPEWRRAKAV